MNPERTLVTAIIDGGKRALEQVLEAGVTAQHIRDEDLRRIFRHVLRHSEKHGKPPSRQAVSEDFPDFEFELHADETLGEVIARVYQDLTLYEVGEWAIETVKRADSLEHRDTALEWAEAELARIRDFAARSSKKDRITRTALADVKSRPTEFLGRDKRYPIGSAVLLAGPGGVGKGTYSYTLAAWVSSGQHGFKPGNVLVLTAEDEFEEEVKPKILAAGGDVSRVFLLSADLGDRELEAELSRILGDGDIRMPLSFPRDTPRLASEIIATEAALVIIDPLNAHVGHGLKTDKAEDMGRILYPLGRVAAATGCVILVVDHVGKGDRDELIDKVLGSVQKVNAVRSALVMVKSLEHGEDARLLFHEKHNKSEKVSTQIILLKSATITDDGVEVGTVTASVGGVTAQTWYEVKKANRSVGKPGGLARAWIKETFGFVKSGTEFDAHTLRQEVEERGEFSWDTAWRVAKDEGIVMEKVGGEGKGKPPRNVWRKP